MWGDAHNDGTIGASNSVVYIILSRNREGTTHVIGTLCVCNIQIIIHSVTVWTAGPADISAYQVHLNRNNTHGLFMHTKWWKKSSTLSDGKLNNTLSCDPKFHNKN